MAILDNSLVFSNFQAVTATAVSVSPTTGGAIDLAGVGSGNAPKLVFGNATTFGQDLGIGPGQEIPRVYGVTGTGTPAGATSLNVQFQGAPDNGSNAPGTYLTYIETGAVVLANIKASSRLFSFDWPLRTAGTAATSPLPRFVQLNYVVAGSNFTGLTIFAGITLGAPDNDMGFYPSNFVVGA